VVEHHDDAAADLVGRRGSRPGGSLIGPIRPMATVHLPSSLALVVPELPKVASVEGATVEEVVRALDARWPGVADRVLEAGPAIRRHINVFVDGEPADLATPVPDGSVVHVIPAVAGG
jgi:molybdopterin converting factor small subunit